MGCNCSHFNMFLGGLVKIIENEKYKKTNRLKNIKMQILWLEEITTFIDNVISWDRHPLSPSGFTYYKECTMFLGNLYVDNPNEIYDYLAQFAKNAPSNEIYSHIEYTLST